MCEKNFEIIKLKEGRNSNHLYYFGDQCLYKKSGKYKEIDYYQCTGKDLENEKCRVKGKVSNNTFSNSVGLNKHEHPNHADKATAEKVYGQLKSEIVDSCESVENVLSKTFSTQKSPVLKILNRKRISRTLRAIRAKKFPKCGSSKDLDEIFRSNQELMESYGYFRNEKLYQGLIETDEGYSASIFVISQLAQRISDQKNVELFIDATFKVSPLFSTQLLVITAKLNQNFYPFAVIMMNSKKYNLYKEIFKYLRKELKIKASKVMSDYEKGMRKAIRAVWSSCEVCGCLFHYCQAIVRKAKQIKALSKKYRHNPTVYKVIKLLTRLPLLPQDKIQEGFHAILKYQRKYKIDSLFKEFNNYFSKEWLSILKSQMDDEYRTNNIIESFNGKLKRKIRRNPTCLTFLTALQGIASDIYQKYLSDEENGSSHVVKSIIDKKLNAAKSKLSKNSISVLGFLQLLS